MDDRQLEAALRAGPPDEPKYRGDIAHLLQARAMSPSNGVQAELAVEVVARPLHRPSLALRLPHSSWSSG